MVEISDEEGERIMKDYCSKAVDYSLLESDNGKFAFTTDDYALPQGGIKVGTVTTNTTTAGINYHAFIHVKAMIEMTKEKTEFVFIVCPFSIKENRTFSSTLGRLLAKTEYGKKNIEMSVLDRTTWAIENEKHLLIEEKISKVAEVGSMIIAIQSNLEVVAEIYETVNSILEVPAKQRSEHCIYCKNRS